MFEFLKEKRVILYYFFAAFGLTWLAIFAGATVYNASIGVLGLGVMYKFYQIMNDVKSVKEAAYDMLPIFFGVGVGIIAAFI